MALLVVLTDSYRTPIKYYVLIHDNVEVLNTNTTPATQPSQKQLAQQNNFKPAKNDIHQHINRRTINLNQTSKIINQAKKEGRKALLEPEAKTICTEYGISVTKFKVASNEGEAAKYADEIGYPVVLKIVSPDIIHKSDAGGVMVNLKNPS